VRILARTTLIVRKSTLVVGKCLDVRRTLRIRVESLLHIFKQMHD